MHMEKLKFSQRHSEHGGRNRDPYNTRAIPHKPRGETKVQAGSQPERSEENDTK